MKAESERPAIHLTIDGRELKVPRGTTVYEAAKRAGIDIPIFCYLDRLPPFGACRMCLVHVEGIPRLQTACTLEAAEGMAVHTQAEDAVKGRKEIIEFLLINHPLDCPICDRGGECPLQDNAWHHGPGGSRFCEQKRRFKKPLPVGPLVLLDRERCIACARCTRFSELLSGDHALEFKERGYRTEVGTSDDGAANSKFMGNTVMICPVGALTSRPYRFRARPWDNAAAASSCTLCPIGCSLTIDVREGEVVRTRSREEPNVNDIWLCDKGWFGYEFVNHPSRLDNPLIRRGSDLHSASWEEALDLVAERFQDFKLGGKVAAFGGNPLTCEENYLFQQLMRRGAGVDHLDHRVGMPLLTPEEEGIPPGMEISLGACEDLDLIFLLGLDLTEEFPLLWLRLRQALHRGARLLYSGHFAPEIASYCSDVFLHPPGQERAALARLLPEAALQLAEGKKGALFVGRQYLSTPNRRGILSELRRFREIHARATLHIMEGRGNSMGARLAGMHPHDGPLGERLPVPGRSAREVLQQAAGGGWDLLYAAGCDPVRQFPSSLWNAARRNLNFLVVQDLFLTETARQAEVVLPASSFMEKEGSMVTIEGRVQRLSPAPGVRKRGRSDGEIFIEIGKRMGLQLEVDFPFVERLQAGICRLPREGRVEDASAIPRAKRAGGIAVTFAHTLFDRGERMRHNPHLSRLVQEPCARLQPQEGEARGLRDGDRVRIEADGGCVCAKIRWDKRVAERTLVLPIGFESELPVCELSAEWENGMEVEISKESGGSDPSC